MATGRVLQTAAGALQIAGNLSGVPYASAAATLLSGIVESTEQVIVNKVRRALNSWSTLPVAQYRSISGNAIF